MACPRVPLLLLLTGALALALARAAAAEEPRPPAFGPTSIAVPADWATRGPTSGVRLERRVPVRTGVRRGAYDITRGPWRPRGPVEVRDQWMLAQPRMTLPAVSPDAPAHRAWTITFQIDRGNDFGWDQTGPAERPVDRRFLVDGEHQTTEVRVRYGLLPRLSVGARVPVYWRGGGFMDQPIDWFHELTEGIGFLDNGRPSFAKDRYRVHGRDAAGNRLSWDDQRGTALGNIELDAAWHVRKACHRDDWRMAWIVRVALPTGGDPYDSGLDVGTQFVVAKRLGRRIDVYAGLGGTWFSDDTLDGIEYEPVRGHGFLALEFHATSCWSFVVEANVASRLITNLAAYPEVSSYVNVSTRLDLGSRFELFAGFTENIADQQGTIDFGAFAGFSVRL